MDNECKEIKNILICGLGAIGSIYAVKITEAAKNVGCNLKILLDAKRLQRYKNEPTVFNGKEYFFDYVSPETLDFNADLVVIATKNNGLDDAIRDIKNFVTDKTLIISLLNGIQSEDRISAVYGKENVLYSYFIGHTSTRVGRNITHDGVNTLVFGKKNNKVLSEQVKSLKSFFEKTNINYEIPEDMDYSRWWKFLVNVGYNQASAVMNAPYGAFQSLKKVNDIAINLMEEAAAVAKAEGVQNTEKLIPEVLKVIEKMLPDTKTSMLQDVLAGRKTEVEIFAGYVSKLGRKYGVKTPYNDMFYEIISAIDEMHD